MNQIYKKVLVAHQFYLQLLLLIGDNQGLLLLWRTRVNVALATLSQLLELWRAPTRSNTVLWPTSLNNNCWIVQAPTETGAVAEEAWLVASDIFKPINYKMRAVTLTRVTRQDVNTIQLMVLLRLEASSTLSRMTLTLTFKPFNTDQSQSPWLQVLPYLWCIRAEFLTLQCVELILITVYFLSDTVLMHPAISIGLSRTHGVQAGENKVTSELQETVTLGQVFAVSFSGLLTHSSEFVSYLIFIVNS